MLGAGLKRSPVTTYGRPSIEYKFSEMAGVLLPPLLIVIMGNILN
jgi:hypothetical protein